MDLRQASPLVAEPEDEPEGAVEEPELLGLEQVDVRAFLGSVLFPLFVADLGTPLRVMFFFRQVRFMFFYVFLSTGPLGLG